MAGHITLNQTEVVDGREWKIHSVEYSTKDGKTLSFYIYALSKEHASYLLEDIKNTAYLSDGEIIDIGDINL